MLKLLLKWRIVGLVLLSILVMVTISEAGLLDQDFERPVVGFMYARGNMTNRYGGANVPFETTDGYYAYEGWGTAFENEWTVKSGSKLTNYEIFVLFWKQRILFGIGRYNRVARKYEASSGPVDIAGYSEPISFDAWATQEDSYTSLRLGYYWALFTSGKYGRLSLGVLFFYNSLFHRDDATAVIENYQTYTRSGQEVNRWTAKWVFIDPSSWGSQFDIKYDLPFFPLAIGVRLDVGIFGTAGKYGGGNDDWKYWNSGWNTWVNEETFPSDVGFLQDPASTGIGLIFYLAGYVPLPF